MWTRILQKGIVVWFTTVLILSVYLLFLSFNIDLESKHLRLHEEVEVPNSEGSVSLMAVNGRNSKIGLKKKDSQIIPDRLILTYKKDLRTTNITLTNEEKALRDNIEYMTTLAKGTEVDFFTDEKCADVIQKYDTIFYTPHQPLSTLFSQTTLVTCK